MGGEEISFGRAESETTPAFYAQDGALGWRLCHLGLEGTFSHKWANRRNVSPPRMHSSESECGRHFLWEGGLQLEGFSGQRLYTTSPRAVFIHGPLYTTHKRDQDAKQLRPMGGLCGLQQLRSDRSTN